jgi:hypothetical protein
MPQITPFGVLPRQHHPVISACFSAWMDECGAARVDRLVAWIKAHRREHLNSLGEPTPEWLSAQTGKKPAYWSDVLRIRSSGKSFGAKAARETETLLGIPQLYLEGAGWPFQAVDQERFERLNERQKGRVEQVLMDIIAAIEAESGKREGTHG